MYTLGLMALKSTFRRARMPTVSIIRTNDLPLAESWQNGYCTGLENRRPKGLGGSSPSLSVTLLTSLNSMIYVAIILPLFTILEI